MEDLLSGLICGDSDSASAIPQPTAVGTWQSRPVVRPHLTEAVSKRILVNTKALPMARPRVGVLASMSTLFATRYRR